MNSEDTFIIDMCDDITINLDSISSNTGTYSITTGSASAGDISFYDTSSSTITIGSNISDLTSDMIYTGIDHLIDSDEVERMCKEYPALQKVWRNFKSVYDMVQQDYEGKKKAGEINDDIPF